MFGWIRDRKRREIAAQPFPEEWRRILRRNMPQYAWLTDLERSKLEDDLRVFMAEKSWEGCQDLHVTDEIKVTIASQAGLMLLGMEHDYFDRVPTILIYPSGFSVPADRWQQGGGFAASGQAVYRGPVIVAWDAEVLLPRVELRD